jgi:hypothetical protein
VLVAADVGNTLYCRVTATNTVAAVNANSNTTATVAATVPGAPTIGTATQTGVTTATVAYTAPASNGGATITSYTATSSPSGGTGTLSQAGSGTISITGLTGGTSYTFTVKATNSVGQSAASAASNSITTPLALGQAYAGGFYAGQISTTANGVANFNLVVGPISTAESRLQARNGNFGEADTQSVINGPANTTAAVAAYGVHPAAAFCENLTTGGFSDWYMPASRELDIMYYNLKPSTDDNNTNYGINAYSVPKRTVNNTLGTPAQTSAAAFRAGGAQAFASGFQVSADKYWTSTTVSPSSPFQYFQYFYNGAQGNDTKLNTFVVRAVRRVAV